MKKQTRSILQELSNINLNQDKSYVIETRASNIIQSAINFIEMIRETYDQDVALELERRFLNSIRTGDSNKFKRGIKKLKEENNGRKSV